MSDKIQKFLLSLDKNLREKLKLRIKKLREDPHNISGELDIKKLKGGENLFRLRHGKIRVIYKITKTKIKIIDIDYRGNSY
jgi:mRNA-degrading endonuclease RelE of RelBE toxin-antitoxin system